MNWVEAVPSSRLERERGDEPRIWQLETNSGLYVLLSRSVFHSCWALSSPDLGLGRDLPLGTSDLQNAMGQAGEELRRLVDERVSALSKLLIELEAEDGSRVQ